MIKNGSNSLAIACFADHPGQPLEAPKDQERKKKGGGKTVSSYFKGQLDDLMTTLYKTEPHFIRCVVPNTHKQPGGVESGLVMHQYQCNGVLAGIAICRAGFPNKMLYPEFKARYNILGKLEIVVFTFNYIIIMLQEPKPLQRPRMTKPLLVPSLKSSSWTRRSGV